MTLELKLLLLYCDFKLDNISNYFLVVACICLLYGYDIIRDRVKQRRGYLYEIPSFVAVAARSRVVSYAACLYLPSCVSSCCFGFY